MQWIKKDGKHQPKINADSNIINDLKKKMADNEKELNDLKKYVKILEELFSRTRDQQHFIQVDSRMIIVNCNTSLN